MEIREEWPNPREMTEAEKRLHNGLRVLAGIIAEVHLKRLAAKKGQGTAKAGPGIPGHHLPWTRE